MFPLWQLKFNAIGIRICGNSQRNWKMKKMNFRSPPSESNTIL